MSQPPSPEQRAAQMKEAIENAQRALERSKEFFEDNGLDGDKDFDSARRRFEQAAQQNVAEAQFMLGLMAELGQGMDKDLQAAQRWLKAAEANKYAAATKELKRVRKLLGGE